MCNASNASNGFRDITAQESKLVTEKPVINREEWLQALGACAPESDESALTVGEMAALQGISRRAMSDHIPALLESGRIIKSQKLVNNRRTVAYRLNGEMRKNS